MNREEYMKLVKYFINKSGHLAYSGMPLPLNFPRPTFMEDKETENNTDTSANKKTEAKFIGGMYFFSNGQEQHHKTSVYKNSTSFSKAMLRWSTSIFFVIGSEYLNTREVKAENVLPLVFLYGTTIDGPGVVL